MTIAVLGLGNMGSSIARRLIDGGHDVVVWNRTASREKPLVDAGARSASTVAQAVSDAEAVLISVRDDDAAASLIDEIAATDVTVPVVNCTTSAPDRTTAMAQTYPAFVAAPILGAPQAVADGTATYVVAGPATARAALEPVWPALTAKVLDCGDDPARASVVKLLSNHLLLTGLEALAEAVVVGQAAGLDDDTLTSVLSSSPMMAPGLRNRLDDVIGGDHDGWFATPLGAKDLGLFVDIAAAGNVTPTTALAALERYREAAAHGYADRDVAAVVELMRPDSSDQGSHPAT
ncbi:NAD(P)-dependent oxidoreductase [Gordonia jinhuaensis]|uniref:Oxidoreductase n=1 Tax=Gordonia jinhuaensis TaxID=1517702 RepID=A0A916T1S1_9ACTN|nr:NAD(P)-dependent oxidoreductase [Gordonia jinhuaensis]GGB26286.1 putative oxidoreductase [Gordonia jinhuaensis]